MCNCHRNAVERAMSVRKNSLFVFASIQRLSKTRETNSGIVTTLFCKVFAG